MFKTCRCLFLVLVLVASDFGIAKAQQLSAIPAAFADVGFGSRPVSMGNAYAGLADDINAVYLNPAGLTSLSLYEIEFTHTRLMGLVNYQFFSAGLPLSEKQSAALAIISSGDDLMREFSLHLGYAREVLPGLSAGAALKYRRSGFGNNTLNPEDFDGIFDPNEISIGISNQVYGNANGFGLDLGLIYRMSDELSFGLMLRDIFAPVYWNSKTRNADSRSKGSYSERVPFEAALGTSWSAGGHTIFSVEYKPSFDSEQDDALRIGFERIFLDIIALRLGTEQWLNTRADNKYMMGAGVQVPLSEYHIQVNYGYIIDDIANTHRIGLQVNF
ncbi:type IX secretion system membrane protein PorP/SprF [Cyclonatronum proteinivorum]|uniref:type IX secretion system membrane protein PorP/SprF n=1 Tax=Cyclonatronum proteinivorum TaxID=1457365 RepID=UPI0013DF09D9|nr:type IX secretion system membrane protein PorP/SprF [Cyclonatronum proteinivorum]